MIYGLQRMVRQGGDEANIIRAGANYGWPIASYSRQYRGDPVTTTPWLEEFEDAQVLWWPSIAPSGTVFYTGPHFPRWQGNLFVGSMMEGRLPLTGHLQRIVFNSPWPGNQTRVIVDRAQAKGSGGNARPRWISLYFNRRRQRCTAEN